jgi:protein-L-isoaspartate O-methyltransferase
MPHKIKGIVMIILWQGLGFLAAFLSKLGKSNLWGIDSELALVKLARFTDRKLGACHEQIR